MNTAEVVRVTVADSNVIDGVWVDPKNLHVVTQHGSSQADIKKNPSCVSSPPSLDEKANAILGLWRQELVVEVLYEPPARHTVVISAQRACLIWQQHVHLVLNQDCNSYPIRLKHRRILSVYWFY